MVEQRGNTDICKIVYNDEELGSIVKTPKEVRFLSIRADRFRSQVISGIDNIPSYLYSVYTLRSTTQGGLCTLPPIDRAKHLLLACEHCDYIELEYENDMIEEVLNYVPPEKRVISWRGTFSSKSELEQITSKVIAVEAAYYIVAPTIDIAGQDLNVLEVLRQSNNKRLVMYGQGLLGLWTQILAVHLGSPIIFCHDDNWNTTGESLHFTFQKLSTDYGLPELGDINEIYGIAGNPVYNSLSPLIHNRSYAHHNMDCMYLPFHIYDFEDFVSFINNDQGFTNLGVALKGFTMVSPFKESTFDLTSDSLNPHSKISKAANILVKLDGRWVSDSSDGYGISQILQKENLDPSAIQVAIFGCGGAGRTIAAMLKEKNAKVQLFNRSEDRGHYAADLLQVDYHPINSFPISTYDVVINATPLGKKGEAPAFEPSILSRSTIIVDLAYAKGETPLISRARVLGMKTYSGREILIHQVSKQFEALTGKEMPGDLINDIVYNKGQLIERYNR